MGEGPLLTKEVLEGRTLMLFDGLCGLCNEAVLWVIKHDHSDHFRFAPQQSDLAAAILARHGIDREATLASNTVYLVLNPGSQDERLLTQSDVTVNLLLLLGGRRRIWGNMLRAVPRPARNALSRMSTRSPVSFSRPKNHFACARPKASRPG